MNNSKVRNTHKFEFYEIQKNVKIKEMSEKNTLQEYCQGNKLPLPKYTTHSQGESHQLEWFAEVTLKIEDEDITIRTNESMRTKVNAEKKAAAMMLERLQIWTNEKEIISQVQMEDIHTIYLIDLENRPCFKAQNNSNSLFIGFINSLHQTMSKYHHWHRCTSDDIEQEFTQSQNSRLLYVIDGIIDDLSDHFMTVLVYPVIDFVKKIQNGREIKIKVVSGDHAGWCTRICIEQVLRWNNMDKIVVYCVLSCD